ncbi:MAG: Eco57I restriction-modification methylase domain-containing protein, partial [Ruminococcus sp.]|nr:Eco57I restriction-modification methylase domain-containing protein [Ruminococcus sp.]
LYPLYLAYNIYRSRLRNAMFSPETLEEHQTLWDTAVAQNIFVICKTPMAKAITRRTLLGFRKGKTNMWAPDDLINKIKNQPDLFIKKVGDLVGKNVKINAIVGNPPYQESNDGTATSSDSIFTNFIDISRLIRPTYISLITPARWMSKQGRGINATWCEELMHCNHFISLHLYPNEKECFPTATIKGGVNYFLFSTQIECKCNFYLHIGDRNTHTLKYLSENDFGVIVRDERFVPIISKICDKDGKTYFKNNSFESMVGGTGMFTDCAKGIMGSGWRQFKTEPTDNHNIKYYYINKNVRLHGWVSIDDIPRGHMLIPFHKVYCPEAGGSGTISDTTILGKPMYGEPGSVCSQSYIPIGYKNQLKTKEECESVIKYIQTRFLRFLVSFVKNTQHATSRVYRFVPMQDFTENSDIDWSKSVEEIDKQLYKKYHLSDTEIAFIESMIKPM